MTELHSLLFTLLGDPIAALHPLPGGRNSQVYRAETEGGGRFAVKVYDPATGTARLRTEYGAFSYLHAHGLRHTPRVIAQDADALLAVYSFVEGEPAMLKPTDHDVQLCASFLLLLAMIGNQRPAWDTPAAEACFSFADVVQNIASRLAALGEVPDPGLQALLGKVLTPLLSEVQSWAKDHLHAGGLSLARPVPFRQHLLSPSDFGLHNALRQPEGSLVFVDFEYFGWDDPAKAIADFLLHPGQTLSEAQKRAFVGALLPTLNTGGVLATRLPVAYALFGLKWCAILLNEFLRSHAARRDFAGDARADEARLEEQLGKAQRMAEHIAATYREFPYLV